MNTLPQADHGLHETDVRDIVRLLGEIVTAPGDLREKRRLVMDGLCELVQATAWGWCVSEKGADNRQSSTGFIHTGPAGGHSSRATAGTGHADHLRRHPDFLLQSADPSGGMAEAGALMKSHRPLPCGGASSIAIFRETGLPHFDEREERIARIILGEIPWLHHHTQPSERRGKTANLYPRHRTVLHLLRQGWSRKKIADHLGVNENTVHGYVKAVFKHFGVHSQSELIAHLTKSDNDVQ